MSYYELEDAEERHRCSPTTFELPSRADRERLRRGDYAKLIFAPGERMWVKVMSRHEGRYRGTLENDPILGDGQLRHGDRVEFGPEHIIDVR